MALRKVTAAEITAARLRKMARDLVLEAEALEATVQAVQEAGGKLGVFRDPVSGKQETIVEVELL